MRLFVILCLCLAVMGCQSGGYVGSGPIKFSQSSVQNYDRYASRDLPMSFAVTKDGSLSFYYYCPWNFPGQCQPLADTKLVYECEKRTKKECLVFARGRQIVWREPGNWRGGIPEGKYGVNFNKRESADTAVTAVPVGRGSNYVGRFFGEGSTPRSEGNEPGPIACKIGEVFPIQARYFERVVTFELNLASIGKGIEVMSGRVAGSKFSFTVNLMDKGSGFAVTGTIQGRKISGRIDSHSCASRFELTATS